MEKLTDIALSAILERVRDGTTTADDAAWLRREIDHMRDILRVVWWQTHAEDFNRFVTGMRVWIDAPTLWRIARMFAGEGNDEP